MHTYIHSALFTTTIVTQSSSSRQGTGWGREEGDRDEGEALLRQVVSGRTVAELS